MGGGSTSKNHNQSRTLSLKQAVSQTSQSARSLSVNGSTRAISMARDFGVTIKKKPRFISHFGLAMAIVGVVVISGVGASQVRSAANAESSSPAEPLSGIVDDSGYGGLVDQTASAYIAANVAKSTDLPVSKDISDKAQDLSSQAAVATNNESYLAKPAVTTGSTSRTAVETYTVVAGDTLDSISQKFNLSVNTIRWANNISGNTNPAPGTQLTILPVNGVLHTVSATDTADGLALLYKANAQQIISFNDAEVDGLKPGAKIVIPDGVVQEAAAAAPVSFSQSSGSMSTSFAPSFSGNGYDYGWCTWWVANRRAAAGKPIPSNWGNAISWRYNAAASGYRVGSAPVAGAVGSQNSIGGWGHVAYVEEVRGDQVRVSEMNYGAGWGRMSQRWEPASVFTYIY